MFGVDGGCDDGVGADGGCDGVGVGMNRCVSVESGGSQRCQHQQSFGSLRNPVQVYNRHTHAHKNVHGEKKSVCAQCQQQ